MILQVVGGFFFFFVALNMGLVDSCSFFSSFRIGVFVPSNPLFRFFSFCKQELFIIVFPLVSMNVIPSSSIVKLHQVLFYLFLSVALARHISLLLQVAITHVYVHVLRFTITI